MFQNWPIPIPTLNPFFKFKFGYNRFASVVYAGAKRAKRATGHKTGYQAAKASYDGKTTPSAR